MRLDLKEVVDSFKISEKYSIVEGLVPTKFVGMTVGEADFINGYKVLVLTLIRQHSTGGDPNLSKEVTGLATAQTVMQDNDILVLFGELLHIRSLLKA
jgi:trk system potassium uptake protein TrkA